MKKLLNIGVIGGKRGLVLSELISIQNHPLIISAVADTSEDILLEWKEKFPDVSLYKNECDLLNDSKVDAIYIATPINFHAQQSINALNAGKHVLCEVPACNNIADGKKLINTVRKTGLNYMMAENYCFIPEHIFVKELCERGEFGEIVYVTSSYVHDCKELFFNKNREGLTWRGEMMRIHGGSNYPTHSIGPVAQWLNINKPNGDKFKRITTFVGSQTSITDYVIDMFGKDHLYASENYFLQSDGIFSIIETYNGVLIELYYDNISNRPPNKASCLLQGTKGSYISGRYDEEENIIWLDTFAQKKEHRKYVPLSVLQNDPNKKQNKLIKQLGKRYAEYMMLNEFISSINEKRQPNIDVRDAVLWSSIIPLSKQSIQEDNIPVEFPNFELNQFID